MTDLQPFQAPIMALLGGVMQYARAYSHFKEWVYHLLALMLATAAYMTFNVPTGDWRHVVVTGALGVSGLVTSLYGGTFLASNAAKGGAAFIPKTDSK